MILGVIKLAYWREINAVVWRKRLPLRAIRAGARPPGDEGEGGVDDRLLNPKTLGSRDPYLYL